MSLPSASVQYLGMYSKQPWFVMYAAKQFSISVSDHPLISHFYSFESDDSAPSVLAIPDGCIDILFDCDQTNPSVQVHGTRLEASSADLPKHHRFLGMRFAPGVLPDFLDISADELINSDYNLLEVSHDLEQLFERVVEQESFEMQLFLLRSFFREKLTSQRSSKLTLPIVNKICEARGNVRIKDLESFTGYTCRTMQRSFQNDMGMTPKMFSRIIRCQSAVYKIHHDDVGFSDLACDLGFSDQSHFLREFKRLVSATPLDYKGRIHQESFVNKIRYY